MKKLIVASVIAYAISLTGCSFIPDLQNHQDSISSSNEILAPADTGNTPETGGSVTEEHTEITTTDIPQGEKTDISPAPPVSDDFSNFKEQYISRINVCLQTMQKTISSNLIATDNALSYNDPFWNAIVEKSAVIDVNPVEITSAVAMLPSESENSASDSGFISFVYEPIFENAKNYSKLNPCQTLAVVAEKTFGISSKSVNIGYLDSQNLYCTYVISDANPDYAVICALYAYTDNDNITKFGVETFARSYSETSDSDGCMNSICNITDIPTEKSFSDSYIVPEHKTMCDIAATVMSKGYYYQRSSANFVSINDGSSYLDDCCHIRSAHYVSWFYLT
ncbi:MAG: hypothetical protein K2I00_01485 [Ruminococcus sp.]|nr:hypothetical protein [Ruminococcus sp.]